MTVPLVHLETVDSTNDEAKRRLVAGTIDAPCAIAADEQTAGRGTRGRHWESPRGAGLYLSYVLPGPIEVAAEHSAVFTLAAGVACAEALGRALDLAVHLKPVNDLYVDGRKLGGILTESTAVGAGVRDLVVGVGINLGRAERCIDGPVRAIALEELVDPIRWGRLDRAALTIAIVEAIARRVAAACQGGRAEIEAEWRARCIDTSPREARS